MVGMGYIVLVLCNYRPHPKDGKVMFQSVHTWRGVSVQSGGGGQVSPAGVGGSGESSWRGGAVIRGGISHPGEGGGAQPR